jgi:thioesterase domain-containing protein/acyl carrier protein
LPTYPFNKRRCWITDQLHTNQAGVDASDHRSSRLASDRVPFRRTAEPRSAATDLVRKIVAGVLGMREDEIPPDRDLAQFGFASIQVVQVAQRLRAQIDPSISLGQLREARTVRDIVNALPDRSASTHAPGSQFPELFRLNQSARGRPVFWFHPGLGGVEGYQDFAREATRPFYGIQARGWMTESAPIQGISAMAAFYLEIVRAVCPAGPYDLGGYSLGGLLAYEVARQIQASGDAVNTILMLDTFDVGGVKAIRVSKKTRVLQAVNMSLLAATTHEPELIHRKLIHYNEVDIGASKKAFLDELVDLARARGLTMRKKRLKAMVEQAAVVQEAYDAHRYVALPLSEPDSVQCYYLRNRGGSLFGALEPYFSLPGDKVSLAGLSWWETWARQMPRLQMIDVDSSSHMNFLFDPVSRATISDWCRTLYAAD